MSRDLQKRHEIDAVPLSAVRGVITHQGMIAELLGIGTVTISSSSTDRLISLRGIRNPGDVKIRIEAGAWREKGMPNGHRSEP